MPQRITYAEYLAVKKSIDDRSLNSGVWSRLADSLPSVPGRDPISVLEIGCGIGTMVERFLERRLLHDAVYTAIDKDPHLIKHAGERLMEWAAAQDYTVECGSKGEFMLFSPDGGQLWVNFIVEEAQEFARKQQGLELWDLVIAHAFLDLIDLEVVPSFLALLDQEGLFYFSLNFDGLTAFLPEIDHAFDRQVVHLYQSSMDARQVDGVQTGGSRTGRKLLQHLLAEGADIIRAGASDWVITPREGKYTIDEVIFLQAIIQTVENELADHPELDSPKFKGWVDTRQAQITRGELIYIAHQLDILGRPKW
jgi:SAM-dependent methyltransferase